MHLANKRCRKLKQRIYVSLTCFLQIRKRWSRFSIQALNIMLFLFIWHERAFLYLSSSFNSGTTAEQVPLWVKNARMFPFYTGFWKGQFGESRHDGHLKANRGWPSSVRHKRGLNFNITGAAFLKHNFEVSQYSDTFCWKFTAHCKSREFIGIE